MLTFKISVIDESQFVTELAISPKTAARRDPEAFLRFAEEIAAIARKLAAERSQMTLNLETAPKALLGVP